MKIMIRLFAILGLVAGVTSGCAKEPASPNLPVEPEATTGPSAEPETTAPSYEQDNYLKRFPVKPDTSYCLTFELETAPAAGSEVGWVIHTFNSEGEQPYDGAYEGDWQRLVPGQTVYRHAFLTVEDAVEVRLAFRGKAVPQLKTATMEPFAVENLVLNGDFALGAGNQSGWSQMNWSSIINEDGKNLLRVNQNGYALTDYFPVEDGGGYKFFDGAKTYPGVKLLAYDQQRRLISPVANLWKNKPPVQMPAGAAYARILFTTWHDHIPEMLTNRVALTGLVRQGEKSVAARSHAHLSNADYEIILASGSDPREVYAARELRHWIGEITGRLPPLLAAPSSKKNIKLYVGISLAQAFTEDRAWLKDSDGYAVRRKGHAIHVFGTKPRGTIYGVFALLERNSDIIWPRPNAEFEALWTPQIKLTFENVDFRSRPTFQMRFMNIELGAHRFQEWMVRNGLNNDFSLHTGFDYLLWERGAMPTYSNTHIGWIDTASKERDVTFYPLIDGERNISVWRQPCFTHPEVPVKIAANIRKALALVPDQPVENINSIIADNWNVCACERCMQPIRLPDGTLLEPKSAYADKDSLFFSTRNFMMLNAVAEDLAKDFPDLKLITHAYIFTAEPPLVKLHPMIVPQFAAYPTQNVRFPIRASKGKVIAYYTADIWKRRFDAWGKWHPQGLGYFGYYYFMASGFNALADTAAIDFQDLATKGGIYAHTEGFSLTADDGPLSAWDVDGAEKWAIARLMWDPSQDPAALRETFMRKVYREAAPQMMAFHALISRGWHDEKSDLFLNCHSSVQDVYEGLLEKPGLVKEARSLLVQGVAAAKHPKSKQLVQRTLDHFDFYGKSLGRRVVPYVEETREDWRDAGSPHWQKALIVNDFKKVDDWRVFKAVPADPKTEVRLMSDGARLCLRVMAYDDDLEAIVAVPRSDELRAPFGDRIEIMIADGPYKNRYLAVGPNGNHLAEPELSLPWEVETVKQADGWVALIAIPLDALGIDAKNPVLQARVGRVYRQTGDARQESTPSGASLYNLHESFWMHLSIEGKE